jgi:prophage tail gpP-like protein
VVDTLPLGATGLGLGPVRPEDDTIVLQLRDSRGQQVNGSGAIIAEIDNFREYTFESHFLTPVDRFSFSIGDEAVSKSILDGIYVGQQVTLSINGHVSAGGFIDRVRPKSSRRQGSEVLVEGRGWLSPAVDANVDPTKIRFNAQNTLLDVIVACFGPYGFGGIGQILASDEANGNIITGQIRGTRTSKTGKSIKSVLAHQLKPYPHEGVFAFASRLTQRFGLWIWASADGANLIVDVPDFTQKAIYDIVHKTGAAGDGTSVNNYEEGDVDANGENQPSVIIADGSSGGGEFGHSNLVVAMVNEITGVDLDGNVRPEVVEILAQYPQAIVLPLRDTVGVIRLPGAPVRAVFLHDDESKTMSELQAFVQREMALRQQHAITARFTFEGHTLSGVPFYTNTIANVDDDRLQMKNRMWCLSRTLSKSRGAGTSAHTEWIIPGTLNLGAD